MYKTILNLLTREYMHGALVGIPLQGSSPTIQEVEMNLTVTADQLKHIIKTHFKSVYPEHDFSKHEIEVYESDDAFQPGQLFAPGGFSQPHVLVDLFIPSNDSQGNNQESL